MAKTDSPHLVKQAAYMRARRAGRWDEAAQLRAEIRIDAAASYLTKIVDEAPPLSAEQLDRLAAILRGQPTAGQDVAGQAVASGHGQAATAA